MASPLESIIGAQISERMWKSAMLWAMLNRASLEASAERIAFFSSIARWTIVRLMRMPWSSSPRRALVATGTSGAPGLGRMIDETAVGLHEDFEQAVENLRQDVLGRRACC